jgi:hypothetical protein
MVMMIDSNRVRRDGRWFKMTSIRFHASLVLAALLGILFAGCGGGGGGTTQSSGSTELAVTTLAWRPPTTFEDNTVMDPYQELDYYEIYVRTVDANFTDNEAPVAQVAAVTNVLSPNGITNQVLTSDFALGNLLPFTQPGAVYYMSVKSVSINGMKSDFSQPVIWDLT